MRVATLDIVLQASLDRFQKSMQTAAGTVQSLATTVSSAGVKIQAMAAAVNATFGNIAGATSAAVLGASLTTLATIAQPAAVALGALANVVGTTLKAAVSTSAAVLGGFADIIKTTFGGLGIGELFGSVMKGVTGLISGIGSSLGRVGSIFGSILGAAAGIAGAAISGVASIIGSVLVGAVQTASAVLGSLATAFMSVAGAITQVALSQFSTITASGRLAARLGIDTKVLAALDLAAGRAGLHVEDLARPMEHLQRVMGEASMGGAEQVKVFGQLGLSVESLLAMPLDQAFGKVSQALQKVSNQSYRTMIGHQLLGRTSGELKVATDMVANSMGELMAKAERMGTALSESDTKAVMAAQRAIGTIERTWEGLKNRIAVALAPAFQRIAEDFSDFVGKFNPNFRAWGEMVTKTILGAEFVVANFPKIWSTAFTAVTKFTSDLSQDVTRIFGVLVQEIGAIVRAAAVAVSASFASMLPGGDSGLMERAWADVERAISLGQKRMGIALKEPFKASVSDLLKDLMGGIGVDMAAYIEGQLGKIKVPRLLTDILGGVMKFPLLASFTDAFTGKGAVPESLNKVTSQMPGAFEEGSREAFDAILKSRQAGDNPLVPLTQQGNALLTNVVDLLRGIAAAGPILAKAELGD